MTEQQMNDIGSAILSMSQDEMNDIIGVIKFRRQQIQERAKAKFSVGDFVWWIEHKSKEKYNGENSGPHFGSKNIFSSELISKK